MSAKEEEELVNKVLKDSVLEYERNYWDGLDVLMALSVVGGVAIPGREDTVVLESPATPWDSALVGSLGARRPRCPARRSWCLPRSLG